LCALSFGVAIGNLVDCKKEITATYAEEETVPTNEDIETYGLLTYEELSEYIDVSEEMFNGVNGQYLKIAIGKGLITTEQLQALAERYGSFVPGDEQEETIYTDEYIKNYIINAFASSGRPLNRIIEQYIHSYLGYYGHIPSSVYSKAKWEVSYDANYFYATVTARYRGLNFVFNIKVAY